MVQHLYDKQLPVGIHYIFGPFLSRFLSLGYHFFSSRYVMTSIFFTLKQAFDIEILQVTPPDS